MFLPRVVGHRIKPQQSPVFLTIWDDIMYVEAFSETLMQFNDEHAIDLGLLDCMRTSSSNSQLSHVAHFLQNFLTWRIILMSIPVGRKNVVIDILFVVLHYWLPSGNLLEIQTSVTAKCNTPQHAAKCDGHSYPHGMIWSDQSLINNVSSLCSIL